MLPFPNNNSQLNKLTYVSPHDPLVKRLAIELLELATGRRKIQKLYDQIQTTDLAPVEVWGEALRLMSLSLNFNRKQLEAIPEEGPLVIIANHPFGVVDGLILGYLASLMRPKFFALVNEVLCRQDERLNEFLLPIDFRESKDAVRRNVETRRAALDRISQGEAMVIFPSGGVATSKNGFGKAEELEWKRFTAQVIQKSRATVVPIYFHGQNSRLFQLISQVSMTLRLGLLLHEVRNKLGSEIRIRIGEPITYEAVSHLKDRQQLIDYLREVTFGLSGE